MDSFFKGVALTASGLIVLGFLIFWILSVIDEIRRGWLGPATVIGGFIATCTIGGFVHWYWF